MCVCAVSLQGFTDVAGELCFCVFVYAHSVSLFVRKKKAILVSLLCKTKFHSNTVSVVVIKLAAVFWPVVA